MAVRADKTFVGKNYRDGMFRDYFSEPKRLRPLVNALLGINIRYDGDIIINTLEGVFFRRVKNDLSCIADGRYLVIAEQQSTVNENMPLRMLSYVTKLFSEYVAPFKEKLYREKRIDLPTPAFFVFYNGEKKEEENRIQRLSDAFAGKGSLELEVAVINLNAGNNSELLEKCPPLKEYAFFVNRVKDDEKIGMTRKEAIEETIGWCIGHGIMADYLKEKHKEVFDMFDWEWNEEDAYKGVWEDGWDAGMEKGMEKGTKATLEYLVDMGIIKAGDVANIYSNLPNQN